MSDTLAIRGGTPMVPRDLHVRWPIITAEDKAAVTAVLDAGVLSGPFAVQVRSLEEEWARYCGVRYALATNSGTAALHTAVAAGKIGTGDQVITTAFTFLATALAVLQQNAVPIFADIDPRTYNIDPARIEERITGRTRAIIPVHIHGLPADMDPILAIAKKHGLLVIEDAAQAHGSTYKGKRVGSMGDVGCFSFQSSKNLPAGEGGILLTDRDDLRERAHRFREFGEDIRESDRKAFDPTRPLDGAREYNSLMMGWMYRTTELTAALCRSQLRRLDASLQQTRRNAAFLTDHLAKVPGIVPPYVPPGCTSGYYQYRIRLDPAAAGSNLPPRDFRQKILAALTAEGVEVSLWQTVPVPGQSLFQERSGYGLACPWKCPLGEEVKYDLAEYPETRKLLLDSLVIGSHSFPLFPQPLALMEKYVEAVQRVFANLDQALA
ncbi:MAG: DegT/DnrJ/EryC1/StrS family aminotransferase [candidate division NC10 bacterium]|nr:DegT/DnrJ/EryC1/StrS family aminotransferase [candidate division NC10 bacterium]